MKKLLIVFLLIESLAYTQQSYQISGYSTINGQMHFYNYSGYVYLPTITYNRESISEGATRIYNEEKAKEIKFKHDLTMDSIQNERINFINNEIQWYKERLEFFESHNLKGFTKKDFRKIKRQLKRGV